LGQSREIAAKIVSYQTQYPGRPVHLIGYSGGGGVAVLALESLPEKSKITSAVLLAPSLAFNYDLQAALKRTEQGIRNFYSPLDIPVLMMLCSVVGTTEGRHLLPAGSIGFYPPGGVDDAQREAYAAGVRQHRYDISMLSQGHPGGHFGWISRHFVAGHIAPLVDPGDRKPESERPAGATHLVHSNPQDIGEPENRGEPNGHGKFDLAGYESDD
jgi:alpha-beta hydrolase superfamily lysophospholipase